MCETFVQVPIQKFTAAYLFNEMTSPSKIMQSAAEAVCAKGLCGHLASENLCAWHIFSVICLQISRDISKIRFIQEHCLPPFSKDLKRFLRSV